MERAVIIQIVVQSFFLASDEEQEEKSYPCKYLNSMMYHHQQSMATFWHLLHLFLGNILNIVCQKEKYEKKNTFSELKFC